MDDVAASVGFAGWAFAAMCDHALMGVYYTSWGSIFLPTHLPKLVYLVIVTISDLLPFRVVN
jgi:hypothetical protein